MPCLYAGGIIIEEENPKNDYFITLQYLKEENLYCIYQNIGSLVHNYTRLIIYRDNKNNLIRITSCKKALMFN